MTKREPVEFWESHLEEWAQSGLTQVAYCANHGLNIKSLARWRSKVRATAPDSRLTLVPLSLAALGRCGAVRLHSPGGWRVDLPTNNAAWLADLLKQLP